MTISDSRVSGDSNCSSVTIPSIAANNNNKNARDCSSEFFSLISSVNNILSELVNLTISSFLKSFSSSSNLIIY